MMSRSVADQVVDGLWIRETNEQYVQVTLGYVQEHILARGIFAPHGEFHAVRSLARSASAAWYWRDRSKIAP